MSPWIPQLAKKGSAKFNSPAHYSDVKMAAMNTVLTTLAILGILVGLVLLIGGVLILHNYIVKKKGGESHADKGTDQTGQGGDQDP